MLVIFGLQVEEKDKDLVHRSDLVPHAMHEAKLWFSLVWHSSKKVLRRSIVTANSSSGICTFMH